MTAQQHIARNLNRLSLNGTLRTIPDIDRGAELYLNYQGKNLLNLSSNNYLGLSGNEELIQASIRAIRSYGTSGSGSRLISGNYSLYAELENLLCSFKEQPASLVTGSGFAANLCILGSLASRGTMVFSDRLNHASIIDSAILSGARQVRYRHSDMEHLAFLLKQHRDCPLKILITDTVFSMDGDIAPLEEIVRLCSNAKALIVVDEAHGTGVFGGGRGLAHHLGLEKEIHVHMGTFSKALGSYGGFIASTEDIISLIISRGRAFIYSTSLPPAAVGASLAALKIVMAKPRQSRKLLDMASQMRSWLQGLGFDTGQSSTQIIPVIIGGNTEVIKARDILIDCGVYCGAIRPPAVPAGTARLRLCMRADMNSNELEIVRKAFSTLSQAGLHPRKPGS